MTRQGPARNAIALSPGTATSWIVLLTLAAIFLTVLEVQ